jgi:hypothetical protein
VTVSHKSQGQTMLLRFFAHFLSNARMRLSDRVYLQRNLLMLITPRGWTIPVAYFPCFNNNKGSIWCCKMVCVCCLCECTCYLERAVRVFFLFCISVYVPFQPEDVWFSFHSGLTMKIKPKSSVATDCATVTVHHYCAAHGLFRLVILNFIKYYMLCST